MRFVQYFRKATPNVSELGIRVGQEIINIKSIDRKYPNNLVQLLAEHQNAIEDLERGNLAEIKERVAMSEVELDAPLKNPDKVICVGMNYKDHCEEQNAPVPVEPIFFSKFASNIIGPFDPIHYPSVSKQLDWEVELAFVIGKKGKNIPAEKAMEHVLGYTVAHDVSARDWQFNKNGGQWLLGKAMDDFCPIGPEIVTKEELTDPHSLAIRCTVNGEVKQNSNTAQLVHKVDAIVAFLSKIVTLLPGDIILTGTPPGVGVFQKPPVFLNRGDIVECQIEDIGTIRNEII